MGPTAEYACVCGKRGSHHVISFHIAEMERSNRTAAPLDDFESDNTKANYLPHAPRKPAPTGASPPLERPERARALTPEPLPPPPSIAPSTVVACPQCGVGKPTCDLPEIAAWTCGHWIRKQARSIAEAFQDMLRSAFEAGAVSTTTGESFEIWYQREVLQ
jgi:hypothetical protein